MHASFRQWLNALVLSAIASQALAQNNPPQGGALPKADPLAAPAPAKSDDEPKKNALIPGRKLTGEGFEKIPRNTTEVFSVAPKKIVPPAPRSTNEQVVAVRPNRVRQGDVPDAFTVTTTDLIGSATIYFTTLDEATGKIEQNQVEFLVVDEISEALQGYLESTIKKTYPTVDVDVLVPNSSTAVLSGYVDRAELVDPITQLVRGFLAARTGSAPDTIQVVNSLRVIGVQQVQLKVIIAEVNRSKLRALGFDWSWQSLATNGLVGTLQNTLGAGSATQLAAATGLGAITPVPGITSAGANAPFTVFRAGSFRFVGLLRILTNNNLGKILAEPTLVTTSGQPAFFNSGGEVPVLIPQGFGTISIQYRPFGTNLSFVPYVLGDGRIRLEVRPEVSELSQANGVTFQGGQIPGFVTRVAETTVELENGQTFAIAGLTQQRIAATATKTPFLGDLPIVGWAFQNKSYQQTDSELIIMVTPYLAEPLDERNCKLPGRESRIPNTQEFFFGSKFEPPCFEDPYRDHYEKHKNEVKIPPPMPVQPYDNYGRAPGMPSGIRSQMSVSPTVPVTPPAETVPLAPVPPPVPATMPAKPVLPPVPAKPLTPPPVNSAVKPISEETGALQLPTPAAEVQENPKIVSVDAGSTESNDDTEISDEGWTSSKP